MRRAISGKCSQICTPGTAVAIGRELAAIFGRGIGLGIERVEMARPAEQETETAPTWHAASRRLVPLRTVSAARVAPVPSAARPAPSIVE